MKNLFGHPVGKEIRSNPFGVCPERAGNPTDPGVFLMSQHAGILQVPQLGHGELDQGQRTLVAPRVLQDSFHQSFRVIHSSAFGGFYERLL